MVVEGGRYVGGLVGYSYVSITNSYAAGNVVSRLANGSNAGGLVGLSKGDITNCYATGTVTGGPRGGLVGNKDRGTIRNTYFDETSTTRGIGTNSAGPQTVTGYSSSSGTVQNNGADITQSDFEGDPNNPDDDWDFSAIWRWCSYATLD